MMTFAQFSFPLNIYAAMLTWSEGRVDYLHYGLFERVDEPIWQAQERASAQLWARMPPPCRVLEVGIGLGHTLKRLQERGFDAVGITPEVAQVDAVRARHGDALAIETTTLEAYAPAGPRFDLMVLQESAQYIQPLALFEAADRLLNSQHATLLVMDEFALRRRSDADFGLHLLPHFKDLAARHGWRLVHEQDVTPQACLTIDVLQSLTQTHWQRAQDELGIGEAELQALIQSNQRYGANYRDGIFGYRVLKFERDTAPAVRPVVLDDNRATEMRALFQRVFGREMGLAEWAWKYGHGIGRGIGLAQRDGRMVAFYGGLTRPLRLFGQPALGCQVCDVMTEPGVHGSLVRQGPMQQVTATFLEAEIGWARTHAVGFGFPTDRALGMAERLGLYRRVDEMVQLRWLPAPAAPLATRIETVDLARIHVGDDGPWQALDTLWAAMAQDLRAAVLGVRDPAWLRYRYGHKPGVAHTAVLLREAPGAAVQGLLVFRSHADHLEVLDLVGPVCHLPALIDVARHVAATATSATITDAPLRAHVKCWITASHAALLQREGDGAQRDSLDLFVPANAHSPGVSPEALSGCWFLTAGDTDFR
jgi:hypothetical protein